MVIEILLGVSTLFNFIFLYMWSEKTREIKEYEQLVSALRVGLSDLKESHKEEIQKLKDVPPTKTQDALEVLHDLRLHGQSLVRIERVDASDIFLKGTR